MKAWRALVALSFLLLSGCLVTFKDPIPANEAAPIPLLGEWTRQDDESSFEEFGFTVAHHGRRWYLSAGLPKSLGANFAIAGFELTKDNELVLYNLDTDRILQDMEKGLLEGQTVSMPEADGALITSPLDKVFAYLDDPANADLFVEVARYQRAAE